MNHSLFKTPVKVWGPQTSNTDSLRLSPSSPLVSTLLFCFRGGWGISKDRGQRRLYFVYGGLSRRPGLRTVNLPLNPPLFTLSVCVTDDLNDQKSRSSRPPGKTHLETAVDYSDSTTVTGRRGTCCVTRLLRLNEHRTLETPLSTNNVVP